MSSDTSGVHQWFNLMSVRLPTNCNMLMHAKMQRTTKTFAPKWMAQVIRKCFFVERIVLCQGVILCWRSGDDILILVAVVVTITITTIIITIIEIMTFCDFYSTSCHLFHWGFVATKLPTRNVHFPHNNRTSTSSLRLSLVSFIIFFFTVDLPLEHMILIFNLIVWLDILHSTDY